jgi:quercetin dioxygenase-like cupin family protein
LKLIKKSEGQVYSPSAHFNCYSVKKLTPDSGSKKLIISHSYFLPNGGCDMTSNPAERVYHVLSGTLQVKGKNNDVYEVGPGDMLYIPPNEEREAAVIGDECVSMIVIMTNPA